VDIYGCFAARRIWGFRYADGKIVEHRQIAVCPENMSS
jgi:hypothetical protein